MIVHQERLNDGRRRIMEVISVEGLDKDEFLTKTILEYDRKLDRLVPTKQVPRFIKKLEVAGLENYGFTIPKWIYGE